MSIKPKEKELAAVGISVAAGCKPCTDHHVQVARKARASDQEIRLAVADALAVRNEAAEIMEHYALAHLGEAQPDGGARQVGDTNRVSELVAVGAAFAVNCVSSLEMHLAAAETVGVSREEIAQIVELATFIKGKAASHVERLASVTKEEAA